MNGTSSTIALRKKLSAEPKTFSAKAYAARSAMHDPAVRPMCSQVRFHIQASRIQNGFSPGAIATNHAP